MALSSDPNSTTSTVEARISSATDRDYYNITVDNPAEQILFALQYEPNWAKHSKGVNGSEFNQVWRVSMLRLQLQCLQAGVHMHSDSQADNEWATRQEFAVTVPAAGEKTAAAKQLLAT